MELEPKVKKDGALGVKVRRGPIVVLPQHELHVQTSDELKTLCVELRKHAPDRLLAADLFCGAGGLSLGLAAAGIDVVLGVDHYRQAVDTHAHHFPGLSVDWDLADADRVEAVARLMSDCGIEVLCGGPPCQPFSKAGRSKIRHRVRSGERDPHDQRRDLWRSFLEVVRLARPRAVIMENVPDMALDREMFILRSIVQELEDEGYSVESRIVDTSEYGVPQFRQRLIIVALAGRSSFTWPKPVQERVSLWNAIGDLPEVGGGWRPDGMVEGWIHYRGVPITAFQRKMRARIPTDDHNKIFDHYTRAVRADDAKAFALMDSSTKYSDLPAELRRYRDDIFDDKYKRLDEEDLSRTITAHIAKDGYWYIHPRQARTITVREAARIQTFPDWYRFAGGPTAAFKQIGNAVPPALGEHLAQAVLDSLAAPVASDPTSSDTAEVLSRWFESVEELTVPWLRNASRWQVIVAALLLPRASPSQVRDAWKIIARWPAPADWVEHEEALGSLGRLLGRRAATATIARLAEGLSDQPGLLLDDDAIRAIPGLSRTVAELAILAVPPEDEVLGEQPVISAQGALRVAARFFGKPVDRRNRLTDGRLALARIVGAGEASRSAQLAVLELANSVCRPADPICARCPLVDHCVVAQSGGDARGSEIVA